MMLSTTTLSSRRRAPLGAAPRQGQRRLPPRVASGATATTSSSSSSLDHLVRVALPLGRARLRPYADADAALGRLMADPLLSDLGPTMPHSSATALAAARVDEAVDEAIASAFLDSENDDAAHLFLQRCLYRVNRLSYIFYGLPLDATYCNERSPWLLALRERIERATQPWQLDQMAKGGGKDEDGAALLARYAGLTAAQVEHELVDVRLEQGRYRPEEEDESSSDLAALRHRLNARGYAHLLALGAHDGLTEASRQSRVCAGTGNPAASACFRILSDEYGGGRLERKHSTYYAAAMRVCGIMVEGGSSNTVGLDPLSEAWLDLVPWESLASANHSFLLAERRRHALRYFGALAAFELAGPRAYSAYAAAADRVAGGAEGDAGSYWRLHVREDSKHGPAAVVEVAVPLARLCGDASAWEVLLGFDQENWMSARALSAARRDIEACGGLD